MSKAYIKKRMDEIKDLLDEEKGAMIITFFNQNELMWKMLKKAQPFMLSPPYTNWNKSFEKLKEEMEADIY